MLKWSLIFLLVAIVAGIFGFTGVSESSMYFAKILFFIALAVFVISLVIAVFRRRR